MTGTNQNFRMGCQFGDYHAIVHTKRVIINFVQFQL